MYFIKNKQKLIFWAKYPMNNNKSSIVHKPLLSTIYWKPILIKKECSGFLGLWL